MAIMVKWCSPFLSLFLAILIILISLLVFIWLSIDAMHSILAYITPTIFLIFIWEQMLGAWRSLCPQVFREPRNIRHSGLSFQRKGHSTCLSHAKVGNWKWVKPWWFVSSVWPGHLKLLQPRPEVASTVNDLFITCLSRGSPMRTRGS